MSKLKAKVKRPVRAKPVKRAVVAPVKELPDYLPENWQEIIIKFRAKAGLTWKGLAALMGVHWTSIYRWTVIPAKAIPSRLVWEKFKAVMDAELIALAARVKRIKKKNGEK